MNRYLTTYRLDTDSVDVFTIDDDYKTAVYNADEWVWQYAETADQAKQQHITKHDEWMESPDKDTY